MVISVATSNPCAGATYQVQVTQAGMQIECIAQPIPGQVTISTIEAYLLEVTGQKFSVSPQMDGHHVTLKPKHFYTYPTMLLSRDQRDDIVAQLEEIHASLLTRPDEAWAILTALTERRLVQGGPVEPLPQGIAQQMSDTYVHVPLFLSQAKVEDLRYDAVADQFRFRLCFSSEEAAQQVRSYLRDAYTGRKHAFHVDNMLEGESYLWVTAPDITVLLDDRISGLSIGIELRQQIQEKIGECSTYVNVDKTVHDVEAQLAAFKAFDLPKTVTLA